MTEYNHPNAKKITDWLLDKAFDADEHHGEEIRSDLLMLLGNARKRFRRRFSILDEDFKSIRHNTAAEKIEALQFQVTDRLLRAHLIVDLVDKWGTLNSSKKTRLRERVAYATAKHPEQVFAALRVASGHPQSGDDDTYDTFTQWIMKEETETMQTNAKLMGGDFDFDVSRLPKKFADEDYRKTYVQAAIQALEKIGREDEIFAAAVIGLMLLENHYDPEASNFFQVVNRFHGELVASADPGQKETINGKAIHIPDGADQRIKIYQRVFKTLKSKGIEPVFFQEFARLGRLASDRFPAFEKNNQAGFENNVLSAYTVSTANGDFSGNGGGGEISLPPLGGINGGSDEIEPDNIHTVAKIYVGFQLEQIGLISAVNRMAEIFMAGLMPLGNDEGARKLDEFYWSSDDFLNDAARTSLFSRTLGASGGQVSTEINPNTEFNTLLLRFVSSVAEFDRNRSISNLFSNGAQRPLATSGEYVRKAGRDLAANISLYGWAGTHFAANRLSRQINKAIEILQLPQILNTYGVSNMWQVLERFNQREFGRNINTVKHRTLAEETRKILEVLADNHTIWGMSGDGTANSFGGDSQLIVGLSSEDTGKLFRAAQYWLAVNGIQDSQVDQYSQPIETVMAPSLPALGGLGGGGGAPNNTGIDQIRQMASQGITPTPEQILAAYGQG